MTDGNERRHSVMVCLLVVLTSVLAWVTGIHATTFAFRGSGHPFGYLDVLILLICAAGLISCAWGTGRLLRRPGHRCGPLAVVIALVSAAIVAVASLPVVLPVFCITYESSGGTELGSALYCSITAPAWQLVVQGEFVSTEWLWDPVNRAQVISTAVSIVLAFALAVAAFIVVRRQVSRTFAGGR